MKDILDKIIITFTDLFDIITYKISNFLESLESVKSLRQYRKRIEELEFQLNYLGNLRNPEQPFLVISRECIVIGLASAHEEFNKKVLKYSLALANVNMVYFGVIIENEELPHSYRLIDNEWVYFGEGWYWESVWIKLEHKDV